MIAQKLDHRTQYRRIIQPRPQSIGFKPGQRQEALRARFVLEQPAQRGKNKRLRVQTRFTGG